MNISILKKYWHKILSWRDYDKEKKNLNPSRAWLIIIILFLVGLIISSGGLVFLWFQISQNENIIIDSVVVAEKLNEQKLRLILLDHTKKVEEFNQIESKKPSVIDPGV